MRKLCCVLVLFTHLLDTQGQDSLNNAIADEQKDIKDILLKNKTQKNSKVLHTSIVPGAGYSLVTGFAVAVGANYGYYTSRRTDSKMSSITSSITYTQHNQTIMPVMANIWSSNAKWNYNVNWHFLQYPSETWGLGGEKDPNDGYTINFSYLKAHQLVVRSVAKNLFVGTGIFYDQIWNVNEVSAPPDGSTAFQRFGLGKDEIALAVPIRILFDSRLNQINPVNGWFASLTWRNNIEALGNTKSWQSLVLDLRKYFQITKSGNTLALWFYSWESSNNTPYLLLPSTGWDEYFNLGRGYVQGRFRSTILEYLEAEYRFKLTRNGMLGGVTFANLQLYKLHLSNGPATFSPAVGAGLRVKLNKYSGTNLSIDYGIGQDGSHGFFINLGEVF